MIPSRSATRPVQPSNTYTWDQMQTLQNQSQEADFSSLSVAADLLALIFDRSQIPFAFMGGFSVRLRGSGRDTHDVDVAMGSTKAQLMQALSGFWRIRRPAHPTGDVVRVFINIADSEDDPEELVGADLIMGGSMGLPNRPETRSEDLTCETPRGQRQYRVLDMETLMSTKLNAMYVRGSMNDLRDLAFLALENPAQVWEFSRRLDFEHRNNFVTKLAQSNMPASDVRKVKLALNVP